MKNLYVDGGSRNNGSKNQEARCCLVDEDELVAIYKLGSKTNNEAEMLAVEKAFEYIKKKKIEDEVIIWSDSQLAVKLLSGEWNASNPRIKRLLEHLLRVWPKSKVTVLWSPRAVNKAGQVLEFGYIQR